MRPLANNRSPFRSFFPELTQCAGSHESSAEARQKHAGLFGVFGEAFAKFFGKESFFAYRFAVERQQHEDKSEKRADFALQQNGPDERNQESDDVSSGTVRGELNCGPT